MANTLKEIAPGCEIYAINGVLYDEEDGEKDIMRINLFKKSIKWAIENKMNILTYSHAPFSIKTACVPMRP